MNKQQDYRSKHLFVVLLVAIIVIIAANDIHPGQAIPDDDKQSNGPQR